MDSNLRRLLILVAVTVGYLCIGAAIFSKLEADAEKERMRELYKAIETFMKNNTCVHRGSLMNLLNQANSDPGLVYFAVNNRTHLDRWDFGGAFGFAVSVVTTIGFGNLSPSTTWGRIVCVIYALFGIPVTLLMLSGLGQQLAVLSNKVNHLKLCSKKPVVNKALNMVLIILLGLLLMFGLPAFVFHLVEGWGYAEALYFCFITLSTIGFGDYIIGLHETIPDRSARDTYQIVGYIWILFGLAYLSLVIKYITDVLVSHASRVEKTTIKRLGAVQKSTDAKNGTETTDEFDNEGFEIEACVDTEQVEDLDPSEMTRIQGELKNGGVPGLRKNKLSKSTNSSNISADNNKNVQLVSISHL